MATIFLVRHGDTRLNSRERFWGQTDVHLNENGLRQAAQLRDRLASHKLDAIYSSNLSRCTATAKIIASLQQAKVTVCEELKEINFGYVEGLTFDEIQERHPKLAKVMSVWNSRPRFPGGESFDELDGRVNLFLPSLKKHGTDNRVLVVAHSAIVRLIICNLMGIGIDHWRQIRIELGSLSILSTYPQGAILSLLNDTSHIREE
jgi:alpha-ribazole phosphatase